MLTLNDGGAATYKGGSGTSALTFTYKVAAGQYTTDLQATGITLTSGASIKDSAGHAADLAGSHTDLGLQVTPPPVVLAISSLIWPIPLRVGSSLEISLAMNEAVVVKGAPTLTLNDSGAATYDAAKSTPTKLVFDYTVATGQNTSELTVTKLNLPTGASIADLAGHALTGTLPASGLGAVIQVDTLAPTITGATATASSKDVDAGKTVVISLTPSENLYTTMTGAPTTGFGSPTLTLNDGGIATYYGSDGTSLLFDYTVAAGQNTSALTVTKAQPSDGCLYH